MRVVIAYESMYGNTHHVADAIAAGFGAGKHVTVQPISELDPTGVDADVLIIGVPTHAHGVPRRSTRQAAVSSAHTKYEDHQLDPSATGSGVREWLSELPDRVPVLTAAFDTRFRQPVWLVGHPARGISRTLARHGATVLARPESFFVDKHEQLAGGELDRARRWGEQLRDLAREARHTSRPVQQTR